jgi:murein DD-endopeptidase MepM/ murein hydrolase activator NlpD
MKRAIIAIAVVFALIFASVNIVGGASLFILGAASSCTSSLISSDLPRETTEYLEGRDVLELAEQNQERYLYAQEQTGVPWQVMAALHYREAGMNPASSISNGAPLGSGENVDGVVVVSDPNEDAANMARKFTQLALSVYNVDVVGNVGEMTLDNWGDAFLAYNRGSLYKRYGVSYTQSPYVMNGFDSNHMDMSWTTADTVSGVDGNKAGALTVLAYLGNVSMIGAPLPDGCVGNVVAPIDSDRLVITSGFGSRLRKGIVKTHYGIDIVGGSQIVAAMSGTAVVAQANYGAYGWAVKIDHGNGTYTLYGHMVAESLQVKVGDSVLAGDPLGTMGTTGDSDGVHLHFQLWIDNVAVNPYPFLIEHGIKLTWASYAYPVNTVPGPP